MLNHVESSQFLFPHACKVQCVFAREMKVGGLPRTLATLCLEILCMFFQRLALMGAV